MNSNKKKIRCIPGSVIAIPLRDGHFSYGRILQEPLIAFYDLRSHDILPIESVLPLSIIFTLYVMNYPITDGDWKVIGNAPLTSELLEEPFFFKKDPISGALTIYQDSSGKEIPATREQCANLECAAVWEPHHILDRLQDHFAGRPYRWIESMRP